MSNTTNRNNYYSGLTYLLRAMKSRIREKWIVLDFGFFRKILTWWNVRISSFDVFNECVREVCWFFQGEVYEQNQGLTKYDAWNPDIRLDWEWRQVQLTIFNLLVFAFRIDHVWGSMKQPTLFRGPQAREGQSICARRDLKRGRDMKRRGRMFHLIQLQALEKTPLYLATSGATIVPNSRIWATCFEDVGVSLDRRMLSFSA